MDLKTNDRKRILLALFILAGIVIILFTASINQMEFSPGLVLENPFDDSGPNGTDLNWNQRNLFELWRIISTIILVVLLPMSIVYFIISKEARKRILRSVVFLTLSVYALFIILQNLENFQQMDFFQNLFQNGESSQTTAGELNDLANSEPSILVTIFAAFFVTLTIFSMVYWLYQRAQAANPPIDDINTTIGTAIQEIKANHDIRNVVIRCYSDLQRIIEKAHGQARKSSMTPREFHNHLLGYGIRHESIINLTRLFEKARYSQGMTTERDETEAIGHLDKIRKDIGGHAIQ